MNDVRILAKLDEINDTLDTIKEAIVLIGKGISILAQCVHMDEKHAYFSTSH